MILAPNLLQLSNGSKIVAFLFIFLLAFGCDTSKRAKTAKSDAEELDAIRGKKRYNPKTGKYEYVRDGDTKLDTVEWRPSNSEVPPIQSSTEIVDETVPEPEQGVGVSENFSRYNIAVLLPFLTDKYIQTGRIPEKSSLAINFYAGMKLAATVLTREGIQLNISVHDTRADEANVKYLLERNDVGKADVIIGPVKKSNLKRVAEFAKMNRKVLVSPIYPGTVTEDNPFYLRVSPSLETHCGTIMAHALERVPAEQIVLVVRNKSAEQKRLKYFQDAHRAIAGYAGPKIKEFIVTDPTADYGEMDIAPYILPGKETVFIVPSWSNELFVYSLLRKLDIARMNTPVTVYGMPQWENYERVSFDYYERLNLHISSNICVDTTDPDMVSFRRSFFDYYGSAPTKDAYKGYDLLLYVGRKLKEHGNKFQLHIEEEEDEYLHTDYAFRRTIKKDAASNEDYDNVDYFENKHVNILNFKGYIFRKVN